MPAHIAAQAVVKPDTTAERHPLFKHSDVNFAGAAIVTVAVATLFDERLKTAAQQPGGIRQRFHYFTALGSSVGNKYPVDFVFGLWAVGFLARQKQLESLGRESTEAFLIAAVATQLMKGAIGRERPSSAAGQADNYGFGRGFGHNEFSSFPSGHTSEAFSIATALSLGTKHSSPLVHRTVSALAFGVATSVGLSRMYDNDHWASDVLGGAAVGIASGIFAIRLDRRLGGRPHRDNVSTFIDHLSIAPAPRGGISLGFSPFSSPFSSR